ncbi:MAG: SMC-Scp complex subunit ScpB [bacterium]|nr:SMC-Scp complex subunit ScpB [bacterium]
MTSLQQKLEALLFIYGEAMQISRIAKILDTSVDKVKEAVLELQKKLEESESALTLIYKDGYVQMVTKGEYASLLETLVKAETNEALSRSALETLAIISYASPISRSDIDFIRGVNSSFILRSLLLRGLIERELDPNKKSSYLYQPSMEMVKHLGIRSLKELPEYEKFKTLAKSIHQGSSKDGL